MPATLTLPALRSTRGAARFAWLTLAAFLLVVLWGAVVRATGSGAGCGSNWPLCNGDFVPHHPRLATLIEFIHRQTSAICTFLDLALLTWTFRITRPRHPARRAVLCSVAFLVLEAALGAVLVLRHDVENNVSTERIVLQAVHLTNTMLLMASLALTAWFLSPRRSLTPRTSQLAPRPYTVLALASTLLVAATGSLAALADTIFPSPSLSAALAADFSASSPLLIHMRWLHPAATLLAFASVLLLAPMRTPLGRIVLALMLLQFVFGIADILLLAPTWMQVLHLLGADLYWIALVLFAAQTLWPDHSAAPLPA